MTSATADDAGVLIERMSSPTVGRLLEAGWDRVIVPVGATEQHGPHMSLNIDSLHTRVVAQHVARALGRTLVAPLLPIGCSEHHMAFPGTMTLATPTLEAMLRDCCVSLARHGFRWILIVSGHGGNPGPLAQIAPALQEAVAGARVIVHADPGGFMSGLADAAAREGVSAAVAGWHAGEFETSLAMALDARAVDTRRVEPGALSDGPDVLDRVVAAGLDRVAPNGVLGDPTRFDAARGRRYLGAYVDLVHGFLASRIDAMDPDARATAPIEGSSDV
jgi:creatinine amidohydrolase